MTFGSLALVTALTVASKPAHAHAPNVNTSRVSLRDEHVEVVAEWDLFLLTQASPTDLATADEDELARDYRALVKFIESETTLTLDGARVPLEVRGFPSPPELRALAASLSAAHEEHGPLVRIRLEAPLKVTSAKAITLASPAKLGPVNASFVQPVNRYVESGAPAAFNVLYVAPAEHATSNAASAPPSALAHGGWPPPLVLFASGLVIGAASAIAFKNRSSSKEAK